MQVVIDMMQKNGLNNLKRNNMEEIYNEFGEVGAPSMGEITKLVYESKYGSDEDEITI